MYVLETLCIFNEKFWLPLHSTLYWLYQCTNYMTIVYSLIFLSTICSFKERLFTYVRYCFIKKFNLFACLCLYKSLCVTKNFFWYSLCIYENSEWFWSVVLLRFVSTSCFSKHRFQIVLRKQYLVSIVILQLQFGSLSIPHEIKED